MSQPNKESGLQGMASQQNRLFAFAIRWVAGVCSPHGGNYP